MNFWTRWGWIEFVCYSVFLWTISSALTIFLIRKDKIDEVINKNFEMYKLKKKKWWEISFHPFGKIPRDNQRRLVPPPHPGATVESKIDPFILDSLRRGKPKNKREENKIIKQAWGDAIRLYYTENVREDTIHMQSEYKNMRRRINKKK